MCMESSQILHTPSTLDPHPEALKPQQVGLNAALKEPEEKPFWHAVGFGVKGCLGFIGWGRISAAESHCFSG